MLLALLAVCSVFLNVALALAATVNTYDVVFGFDTQPLCSEANSMNNPLTLSSRKAEKPASPTVTNSHKAEIQTCGSFFLFL